MQVLGPARLIALLGPALLGCRSGAVRSSGPSAAASTAPTEARVAPSAAPVAIASAPAGGEGGAASVACRVTSPPESIDDAQGAASAHGTVRLENLRVMLDGETTAVTWERQADFAIGDSWREPVLALRRGAAPFRVRSLPVMAYACATNGYAGPLSAAEPFVSWGARNMDAFEVWRDIPDVVEDPSPRIQTRPLRAVATRQHVASLAVARSVALAGASEPQCPEACNCARWTAGVWLYPLRSGAKAVRITGVADRALAQVAPAIAMDERGGVGAYRIDGALSLVFVDAGGGLAAPPVEIDRGEVGAPALAVAEGRALVTWAKRASAKDPYVLHWMLLDLAARDIPAARTWATAGGAFAPTVVTDGTHAVIAWMEGDDGKRGKILVARTRLDRAEALDGIPVSLDTEGNARDPEIAGPASAPTVVYAVFTKQRPGGVARLARVTCGG